MTGCMYSPFNDAGRRSPGPGCLLLWLAASLPPAQAIDSGPGVQAHGFLSQGFVKTSDNRWFGDSEEGSVAYTELGVNASLRAAPDLLLSGQLIARRAGDMYDGSPSVDFALVDWTFSNSLQRQYGIVLGRIKNALGLYNDTRDVAFTRPSIFLPQQIYFDKVRNLLLSSDGIKLYGQIHSDAGNWEVGVATGRIRVDENTEISFLGRDFGGDLDSRGVSLIGNIAFTTHDATWWLALSGARVTLDFDTTAADLLLGVSDGEIDVFYWIMSGQYNAERWSVTAEYMEEPLDFAGFGPAIDANDGAVQGYYLQGSYLLRDDLTLLLRYAEGFTDKDDRDGRRRSAVSGGLAPRHLYFQKDWMFGLRWDVSARFMLRAEYQWNKGTWTLAPRENPVPSASVRDWNMIALLASYRF